MSYSHLLNAIESNYYFNTLLYIAQHPTSDYRQKLQQANQLFLSLLNTLTEQREKLIFTGWFAKINFIAQAYNLGAAKEDELQSLRRLLRRCTVQKDYQVKEELFLNALKILSDLIDTFSAEDIPLELAQMYQDKPFNKLIFKESPKQNLETLYANIIKKGEIQYDEAQKGYIDLECDTENYGIIQVRVQDLHYHSTTSGELFRKYELSKHCAYLIRPFQSVCLTHLEKIDENSFHSTKQTLLIASPDYLVDATAIANCFTGGSRSPYLYLLNKLSFFRGNEFTFAGRLINDMLDHFIAHKDAQYEKVFREIFVESQMEAAFLELNREKLKEIYYRLKPQFANLTTVMSAFLEEQAHTSSKIVTAEPSFISGQFGLQGRIDLLVEYAQNSQRKDIIELKGTSYSDPQIAVARNDHLIQVACYNLLIDSTFEDRKGVSAILYSRDEKAPLRDCGKLNFQEQDAMWMRNCMVFIDSKMAQGEEVFYDRFIQKLSNLKLPVYKQEEVEQFVPYWQKAQALDKAYFSEFMGLISRELWVAKVGSVSGNEPSQGYSSLWRNSIQEKQDSFSLLNDLSIRRLDKSQGEIEFIRPPSESTVTAFREGDIIVLYPSGNNQSLAPNRYQLLKGNIVEIHPESVKVRIWHKAIDEAFLNKYTHWAIEPNLMESNFNHQFASLAAFLKFSEEKRRLFLGLQAPRFQENFQLEYRPDLSKNQNTILKKALSAQDYFLLQGPPGTGKTSKMLRSMLEYLYKFTDETIVLLAFTNRATDEICQKIEAVCEGNFIRLGNIQEDSAFREFSLKQAPDIESIRQKLQDTRVFVSTVSSFYGSAHLIKNYDTVIVDEASQLLEPSLCGILPRFRRFILIGDEKQLPAVVTQPQQFCQTENPHLHAIGIQDLSVSVFERLLENAQRNAWHFAYDMLATQFRTHQDIAGFINQEFYHGLKIGAESQTLPLEIYNPLSDDTLEQALSRSRLIFMPSQAEDSLKFHLGEAGLVISLLETIRKVYKRKNAFSPETVGVITPYRAQIAQIYQALDEELRENVTVDTVERYQGSEREVIIISMAVNHPAQMKNLQAFNTALSVDKKLNVALSRAKAQLILLGNAQILNEGKFYKKLLDYIRLMNE